jgi:hypothetical protein
MSTGESVAKEESIIAHNYRHLIARLELTISPKRSLSHELVSISYHHQMDADAKIRQRSPTSPNAFPKFLFFIPFLSWIMRLAGCLSWELARKWIQARCPIAMSYWSEPSVRRRIDKSLIQQVHILYDDASETHPDVRFVFISYTIGSIVTSLALGQIERHHPALFDKVQDHVTLGCPIGWFGNVQRMELPSRKWTNFYYRQDVCATPLRPSLGCVADISIPMHVSYAPNGQNILVRSVLWFISLFGLLEFFGAINGLYLSDAAVWNHIESSIILCAQ